uniref:Uncharacterized protein n=1 Tax=Ciona savignyi TaxID=51511 RepID=H2Y822_CIOSA
YFIDRNKSFLIVTIPKKWDFRPIEKFCYKKLLNDRYDQFFVEFLEEKFAKFNASVERESKSALLLHLAVVYFLAKLSELLLEGDRVAIQPLQ